MIFNLVNSQELLSIVETLKSSLVLLGHKFIIIATLHPTELSLGDCTTATDYVHIKGEQNIVVVASRCIISHN